MGKSNLFYGKAVYKGALQFTSPSGLARADTAQPSGCLRRWWYHTVAGIREEQQVAAGKGDEYHGQIEHYEKTGVDMLSAIPRRALPIIPTPGPDLMIEWPLAPALPDAQPFPPEHKYAGKIRVDPKGSCLWAGPVPVIGFIDLAHARGINKGGGPDGEDAVDPLGTVEVQDWKFTNKLAEKLARTTPDGVATETPMVGYGHAVACAYEAQGYDVPLVRLSYGLISMGKAVPAAKVSKLVPRDEIARRWEARAPLARTIFDAARETDPNKIESNTRACDAYGRACPARTTCSAGQYGSLEKLYTYGLNPNNEGKLVMGSVLDALKNQQPAQAPAAPAQAYPPGVQQLPATVGTGVAMTLPPGVGGPPPAPPPPAPVDVLEVPPDFAQAWAYMESAGCGTPTLKGKAARCLTAVKGWPGNPAAHNGTGQIGVVQIEDPADVARVALELYQRLNPQAAAPAPTPQAPPAPAMQGSYFPTAAPAQAPGTAPVLSPDAPASQPHLAAQPVQPTVAEVAAGTFPPIQQPPAPPGPAAAVSAPPAPPPAATPPHAAVEPQPERKTRTRKAKATDAPAAPAPAAATTAEAPTVVAVHVDPAVTYSPELPTSAYCEGSGTLELFVDSIPSCSFTDLGPKIDEWAAQLAAAFKADDIRCASEDTPIGYNKWKGGFAAYVSARVKDGDLPPGVYVLFARRNEVHEVAANALRLHCDLFVRGV